MVAKAPRALTLVAFAAAAVALGACGSGDHYQAAPPPNSKDRDAAVAPPVVSSGNSGGLFSGSRKPDEGVAVNAFLWRASLDTIAFMPLVSADPFGGVIISDWYVPPESADERFKVNIYILGRVLRADGLKVSVFRQTHDASGQWKDATIGPEVSTEFENAVLTQARELRLRAAPESN